MERAFIETKVHADEDGTISGIAWPFGQPDRVGDVIEKGAFAGAPVPLPMLFGHDGNDPIGAWSEAKETDAGLELSGHLLVKDLHRAREVNALVKAGAVRGISIGFITQKSAPRSRGGRTITKLELVEASLVAIPMHPGARVTSAKSAVQALRLAGILNRAAAHIARKA